MLGVGGGALLQRRGTETSQRGLEAEPRALTSGWPCPAKAMPSHPHFTGGGTEHQRGQVTFPVTQQGGGNTVDTRWTWRTLRDPNLTFPRARLGGIPVSGLSFLTWGVGSQ